MTASSSSSEGGAAPARRFYPNAHRHVSAGTDGTHVITKTQRFGGHVVTTSKVSSPECIRFHQYGTPGTIITRGTPCYPPATHSARPSNIPSRLPRRGGGTNEEVVLVPSSANSPGAVITIETHSKRHAGPFTKVHVKRDRIFVPGPQISLTAVGAPGEPLDDPLGLIAAGGQLRHQQQPSPLHYGSQQGYRGILDDKAEKDARTADPHSLSPTLSVSACTSPPLSAKSASDDVPRPGATPKSALRSPSSTPVVRHRARIATPPKMTHSQGAAIARRVIPPQVPNNGKHNRIQSSHFIVRRRSSSSW